MIGLSLGLGLSARTGGGGLSRYAIIEDGVSYVPLFVWDASTQRATKRDFSTSDYAVIEGGVSYNPLFVWDAYNQVAVK